MALLSGGGSWLKLQSNPAGSKTVGRFVSFEANVPSSNPAYPPQDVLKLEVNGETKSIGCPTALGRVFKANVVAPGTLLEITYEGKKVGKRGVPFHSFSVESVEEDTSFPPAGTAVAQGDEEAELERRLAEARARKAQTQAA